MQDPLKLTAPGGVNVIHAQDVARAHMLLCERARPYERHIVASENWTWETIHRTIAELAGCSAPRVTVGRKGAIVGATFMELGSKLTGKAPLLTREMARGRSFSVRDAA